MTRRQWLAGIVGFVAAGPRLGPTRSAWAAPADDRTRAMTTLRALIHHHTRDPRDAWAIVHGVRAMGAEWSVHDGTRAVDYVLATLVKMQAVGQGRHLYVPLEIEMHLNSFLETFLSVGVGWQQPARAENRVYSFRDLFDHARMLFSFSDPGPDTPSGAHHRESDWFAWSLIAFPFGIPPSKDGWQNAFGQEIRVARITAMGLQMLEEATAPLARAMERGELLVEKVGVHTLTSGGAHLISGVISAVQHGYTQGDAAKRLARQLDILVYRLITELQLISRFYQQDQRHPIANVYELDTRLYFLGHALRNLTVARRGGVFRPTLAQQRQIQEAESALYGVVDRLRGFDLEKIRKLDERLFQRLVGDASYAYEALRLAFPLA